MKKAIKLTPEALGFVRVAAVVPKLQVGNIDYNVAEICELAKKASANGASFVVFPELCITGYTVGDLFQNELLLQNAKDAMFSIANKLIHLPTVFIIGLPLEYKGSIYNAACVIERGRVIGIVPKSFIPNYSEFYEKRWFTEGGKLPKNTFIQDIGSERMIPFGTDILFQVFGNDRITLGIEICEDLWVPIPPSSRHTLAGATIVANLSASNEIVGKVSYRRDLVQKQSAGTVCAYIYASCGVNESSTDLVFSGHALVAENGTILAESKRFDPESQIVYSDVDTELLAINRKRTNSFADSKGAVDIESYRTVYINPSAKMEKLDRHIARNPFVPENEEVRIAITEEIFNIQSHGLATRLRNSKIDKIVLGLSGGLDSTLAMLVAIRALDILKLPKENLILVTMPGFGTTSKTKNNAGRLAEAFGINLEEVDITLGTAQQLKDAGHDGEEQNSTYENAQARYRMMTLQDIANERGGLVLGTGDLSELALGWCTFGGDHTTTYGVNGSVPKTLVQHVVRYGAKVYGGEIEKILIDILETPISPELLKGDKDNPSQKTEEVVGPYELHDFFLFHFMRRGSAPEKVLYLAKHAFGKSYETEVIRKWLLEFMKRFFSQQFKRSILPDGPKVGSVSLSPRGDWRMPSDADRELWIENVKNAII